MRQPQQQQPQPTKKDLEAIGEELKQAEKEVPPKLPPAGMPTGVHDPRLLDLVTRGMKIISSERDLAEQFGEEYRMPYDELLHKAAFIADGCSRQEKEIEQWRTAAHSYRQIVELNELLRARLYATKKCARSGMTLFFVICMVGAAPFGMIPFLGLVAIYLLFLVLSSQENKLAIEQEKEHWHRPIE